MNRVHPWFWIVVQVTCLVGVGVPSVVLAQAPAEPPPTQQKTDPQPDLINPDRPGIADGSNVIGRRRFQIELGVQQESRKDGDTSVRTTFIPTLLRFGLNDRWEARVEGNNFTFLRTSDPIAGVTNISGLAPASIGFKYHFQDQRSPGKRPSLGTIFRLFPASGSSDFATHHTTGDLRLVADWAVTDQWSLNPNAGVAIYEDGQGGTFTTGLFALTLNYNPTPRINPFIDMGLQAPEQRNGRSSLIFDLGLAFIVSQNLQLDVSYGTGTLGHTPPHPFWSLGISARFN